MISTKTNKRQAEKQKGLKTMTFQNKEEIILLKILLRYFILNKMVNQDTKNRYFKIEITFTEVVNPLLYEGYHKPEYL